MKAFQVAAIVAVCTLTLSACEKLKEVKEAAEKMAGQVAGQVEQAADPTAEMLGAYAKGYNEALNRFDGLIDNYTGTFPFDKEPSAEQSRVRLFGAGPVQMSLDTMKEAFAHAKDKGPEKYKHLQPLADELFAACQELSATYDDAAKYYEAEDFKDDEFARGRELHGKMRGAADRYRKAMREMGAALSVEEDRMMEEELAEYKEKGGYSYYMRYLHVAAKKALTTVDRPNVEDTVLFAAVDDYLAALEEVKTFADGKADLHAAFKSYLDQGERFAGALKRLRRELQADKADPDVLRREHDAAVSAFNTVVSLRNSLGDLEGYGQLK